MGFFDDVKAHLEMSTDPTMESDDISASPDNLLPLQLMIEETFPTNTPNVTIVTGKISSGMVRIGSQVMIATVPADVVGVENFNKQQPMTVKEELFDKVDRYLSTTTNPYIYVGMPPATYGVTGDAVGLKLLTSLTAGQLKGASLTGPALQVKPAA